MGNAFKAVLAGGSGNKVIVTCAPQFAGATITCTNNTKTYTKVCPSTAPYTVEFKGLDVGTWTISGTIQGTVFTTTVEVQDVSAVLSYGFVWNTWVDTASQLDSTDYNTLDELLEDEKAVRELMLEHACVDYMSSFSNVTPNLEKVIENDICAKWINLSDYALDTCYANTVLKAVMDEVDKYGYGEWVITDNTTTPPTWGPKGNIPIMTANNAPYCDVSADSQYGTNYAAWKAFDGDANTVWIANHLVDTVGGTASDSLVYHSVNPIQLKAFKFSHDAARNTTQIEVSGSNDGTVYVPIKTISNPSTGMVRVDSTTYYMYHKISMTQATTTSGSYYLPSINVLQFYGRELSDLVPPMISNTLPSGEAFASSTHSESRPYYAFDKSDSSIWVSPQGNTNNYVGYEFNTVFPVLMAKVKFSRFATTGATMPARSYTLASSDDGTTYGNALATFSVPSITASNVTSEFIASFAEQNKKYFRLFCADNIYVKGTGYIAVAELQFYGKDYSEKEFEAGTTKKWLYDHGVELETLTPLTVGSGSVATKNNSNVYVEVAGTAHTGAYLYKQLDLTNYDLLRGKVDDMFYASTASYGPAWLSVFSQTPNPSNTGLVASVTPLMGDGNLPDNLAIDISSIDANDYVSFCSGNANGTIAKHATFNELWLE